METKMALSESVRKQLLIHQKNEITEHEIYKKLAKKQRDEHNRSVLDKIAVEEYRHYRIWQKISGKEVKPDRRKVFFYCLLNRIFGFTFAVKLMENGETDAQESYRLLIDQFPEAEGIMLEENEHEKQLVDLLDEERLRYAGSMVLGLNDALVELTGALAGLTLALQNTRLIALSGLITGFAAALSMAASEYLSTKSENDERNPRRAAFYTGTTYVLTVALLILPYLLLKNYFVCLAVTLAAAIAIIAVFNYFIAVARGESFSARFWEMSVLSFSVALLSFLVGYGFRMLLGVDL
ncbi:MAG: rubrerythrin family protein [Calditrichaeota bacterium]|nr:rubrerythrin family protein [Calditrichota bacterium]